MPINDLTTNRSYKLPNAGNLLSDDVQRLRDALTAIDADVFARYTKTETDQKLAALINGAPGALDTLNELAAAMGNDPNFATTITNALAGKPGFADVWTRTQADARYVQGISQTENTFTGTGSQTTFTLSQTPPTRESLLVTVDGVVQPVSAYTLSGSALILSEAPASGASIRVLMLGVAGPVQSASTLNFAQPGTGAVTRTVESKLRDVVSVKDFGAVGDFSNDDTTSIQNAANYAIANQKSLYFPAGNYLVRQCIRFNGVANISIYGEGYCNTRLHLYSLTGTNAAAALAVSDNAAQVIVRGLYFTVDANSISRNCCLAVEYASSVFISDCFFGGALYGLNLRGVIDSGVENCSIENASNAGIMIDDNTGNYWSPSNPAVRTFGCARISINNCIIVTNGGGTSSSNQFTFNGITINKGLQTILTGCQFYGNTDTNIYLLAAIDTHFVGCHFGDPVSNSSLKNFIIANGSTARFYLTGCDFGDGNAGATPISDIVSLGYVAGSEAHIVNCKVNATPSRSIVYDTDGGTLKTWVGGPAPIPTLSGVAWAVCSDGRWMWSNGAYKTYYKHGRPASATDGALFSGGLEAFTTYDPPALNNGVGTTMTLTCTGAALGDVVTASFSLNLQGVMLSAWVSAANTVAVHFFNASGGTLDLASGTVRVRVDKA